jgi:hypothetical protein
MTTVVPPLVHPSLGQIDFICGVAKYKVFVVEDVEDADEEDD